jgi:heat shock protein HslJ
MLRVVAAAVVALGLVAACGADPTDVVIAKPLQTTPWELDPSTVPVPGVDQALPTLMMIDGLASGFAGCNTYRGQYTVSESTLRFGELAVTRMACEPVGTAIETAFLDRLKRVARYQLTRTGLDLQDASGGRVLAFVPANTALAGDWTITGALLSAQTAFTSVAATPPPTASFAADGTMSGNTGCNTMRGSWTQGPDEDVTFGPLAVTLKACASPELSAQEAAVLDAFNTARTAEVTSHSASLFNGAGQRTMSLQR